MNCCLPVVRQFIFLFRSPMRLSQQPKGTRLHFKTNHYKLLFFC
ncbi:unnamed protein product [Brugia timori]|uniref:Uncharacterized protein n=1 Tax=Brugia timori TaxID=42155 RepID=A0A0R3R2H9_9BILA|nr:unnamed protein product [Brugia timori]